MELSSKVNLCTARERPWLPLRGLAFERRLWRMQRERQADAVRKCESEQPKHERLTAKGVEQHLTAALL